MSNYDGDIGETLGDHGTVIEGLNKKINDQFSAME
jgi:hypothetical protein